MQRLTRTKFHIWTSIVTITLVTESYLDRTGSGTSHISQFNVLVTICIEVIFSQTTFVGFGSGSKTHTVDCCFVSSSYAHSHDSSPVMILLTSFEASPSYFANISLHQSTRVFFWAIAGSNENKSFLRPGVHAISNVCWWKKCPGMPLSYCMSHDDLALSVHARHQCSLAERLLLEDLHGIRLWVND